MPGSVAAAAPAAVMPYSLAVAFQRSQEWPVEENVYRDGEIQRQVNAATSRKSWSISKALSAAALAELRTFYLACGGGATEFYFYDLFETSPAQARAGYDDTGAASAGRYVVRFAGAWRETLQLGRNLIDVLLIEVS